MIDSSRKSGKISKNISMAPGEEAWNQFTEDSASPGSCFVRKLSASSLSVVVFATPTTTMKTIISSSKRKKVETEREGENDDCFINTSTTTTNATHTEESLRRRKRRQTDRERRNNQEKLSNLLTGVSCMRTQREEEAVAAHPQAQVPKNQSQPPPTSHFTTTTSEICFCCFCGRSEKLQVSSSRDSKTEAVTSSSRICSISSAVAAARNESFQNETRIEEAQTKYEANEYEKNVQPRQKEERNSSIYCLSRVHLGSYKIRKLSQHQSTFLLSLFVLLLKVIAIVFVASTSASTLATTTTSNFRYERAEEEAAAAHAAATAVAEAQRTTTAAHQAADAQATLENSLESTAAIQAAAAATSENSSISSIVLMQQQQQEQQQHEPRQLTSQLLLLLGLLVLINLIVIFGNILVILAVYASAKLRSVTNIFIVSLATADLLLGLFVLPYALTFEILDVWIFGRAWCRGWLVIDVWISTASILNLCAISVDRYVAVTRPVKYRSVMTPHRAKTIVAFVWIISFLICFPPLLSQWNPSAAFSSSSTSTLTDTFTSNNHQPQHQQLQYSPHTADESSISFSSSISTIDRSSSSGSAVSMNDGETRWQERERRRSPHAQKSRKRRKRFAEREMLQTQQTLPKSTHRDNHNEGIYNSHTTVVEAATDLVAADTDQAPSPSLNRSATAAALDWLLRRKELLLHKRKSEQAAGQQQPHNGITSFSFASSTPALSWRSSDSLNNELNHQREGEEEEEGSQAAGGDDDRKEEEAERETEQLSLLLLLPRPLTTTSDHPKHTKQQPIHAHNDNNNETHKNVPPLARVPLILLLRHPNDQEPAAAARIKCPLLLRVRCQSKQEPPVEVLAAEASCSVTCVGGSKSSSSNCYFCCFCNQACCCSRNSEYEHKTQDDTNTKLPPSPSSDSAASDSGSGSSTRELNQQGTIKFLTLDDEAANATTTTSRPPRATRSEAAKAASKRELPCPGGSAEQQAIVLCRLFVVAGSSLQPLNGGDKEATRTTRTTSASKEETSLFALFAPFAPSEKQPQPELQHGKSHHNDDNDDDNDNTSDQHYGQQKNYDIDGARAASATTPAPPPFAQAAAVDKGSSSTGGGRVAAASAYEKTHTVRRQLSKQQRHNNNMNVKVATEAAAADVEVEPLDKQAAAAAAVAASATITVIDNKLSAAADDYNSPTKLVESRRIHYNKDLNGRRQQQQDDKSTTSRTVSHSGAAKVSGNQQQRTDSIAARIFHDCDARRSTADRPMLLACCSCSLERLLLQLESLKECFNHHHDHAHKACDCLCRSRRWLKWSQQQQDLVLVLLLESSPHKDNNDEERGSFPSVGGTVLRSTGSFLDKSALNAPSELPTSEQKSIKGLLPALMLLFENQPASNLKSARATTHEGNQPPTIHWSMKSSSSSFSYGGDNSKPSVKQSGSQQQQQRRTAGQDHDHELGSSVVAKSSAAAAESEVRKDLQDFADERSESNETRMKTKTVIPTTSQATTTTTTSESEPPASSSLIKVSERELLLMLHKLVLLLGEEHPVSSDGAANDNNKEEKEFAKRIVGVVVVDSVAAGGGGEEKQREAREGQLEDGGEVAGIWEAVEVLEHRTFKLLTTANTTCCWCCLCEKARPNNNCTAQEECGKHSPFIVEKLKQFQKQQRRDESVKKAADHGDERLEHLLVAAPPHCFAACGGGLLPLLLLLFSTAAQPELDKFATAAAAQLENSAAYWRWFVALNTLANQNDDRRSSTKRRRRRQSIGSKVSTTAPDDKQQTRPGPQQKHKQRPVLRHQDDELSLSYERKVSPAGRGPQSSHNQQQQQRLNRNEVPLTQQEEQKQQPAAAASDIKPQQNLPGSKFSNRVRRLLLSKWAPPSSIPLERVHFDFAVHFSGAATSNSSDDSIVAVTRVDSKWSCCWLKRPLDDLFHTSGSEHLGEEEEELERLVVALESIEKALNCTRASRSQRSSKSNNETVNSAASSQTNTGGNILDQQEQQDQSSSNLGSERNVDDEVVVGVVVVELEDEDEVCLRWLASNFFAVSSSTTNHTNTNKNTAAKSAAAARANTLKRQQRVLPTRNKELMSRAARAGFEVKEGGNFAAPEQLALKHSENGRRSENEQQQQQETGEFGGGKENEGGNGVTRSEQQQQQKHARANKRKEQNDASERENEEEKNNNNKQSKRRRENIGAQIKLLFLSMRPPLFPPPKIKFSPALPPLLLLLPSNHHYYCKACSSNSNNNTDDESNRRAATTTAAKQAQLKQKPLPAQQPPRDEREHFDRIYFVFDREQLHHQYYCYYYYCCYSYYYHCSAGKSSVDVPKLLRELEELLSPTSSSSGGCRDRPSRPTLLAPTATEATQATDERIRIKNVDTRSRVLEEQLRLPPQYDDQNQHDYDHPRVDKQHDRVDSEKTTTTAASKLRARLCSKINLHLVALEQYEPKQLQNMNPRGRGPISLLLILSLRHGGYCAKTWSHHDDDESEQKNKDKNGIFSSSWPQAAHENDHHQRYRQNHLPASYKQHHVLSRSKRQLLQSSSSSSAAGEARIPNQIPANKLQSLGLSYAAAAANEMDKRETHQPSAAKGRRRRRRSFDSHRLANESEKIHTTPKIPRKVGCALFDDKPYVIYSALGSFYIPMFIMIFFYSRIYLVASRAHKAMRRGYMTTKWPPMGLNGAGLSGGVTAAGKQANHTSFRATKNLLYAGSDKNGLSYVGSNHENLGLGKQQLGAIGGKTNPTMVNFKGHEQVTLRIHRREKGSVVSSTINTNNNNNNNHAATDLNGSSSAGTAIMPANVVGNRANSLSAETKKAHHAATTTQGSTTTTTATAEAPAPNAPPARGSTGGLLNLADLELRQLRLIQQQQQTSPSQQLMNNKKPNKHLLRSREDNGRSNNNNNNNIPVVGDVPSELVNLLSEGKDSHNIEEQAVGNMPTKTVRPKETPPNRVAVVKPTACCAAQEPSTAELVVGSAEPDIDLQPSEARVIASPKTLASGLSLRNSTPTATTASETEVANDRLTTIQQPPIGEGVKQERSLLRKVPGTAMRRKCHMCKGVKEASGDTTTRKVVNCSSAPAGASPNNNNTQQQQPNEACVHSTSQHHRQQHHHHHHHRPHHHHRHHHHHHHHKHHRHGHHHHERDDHTCARDNSQASNSHTLMKQNTPTHGHFKCQHAKRYQHDEELELTLTDNKCIDVKLAANEEKDDQRIREIELETPSGGKNSKWDRGSESSLPTVTATTTTITMPKNQDQYSSVNSVQITVSQHDDDDDDDDEDDNNNNDQDVDCLDDNEEQAQVAHTTPPEATTRMLMKRKNKCERSKSIDIVGTESSGNCKLNGGQQLETEEGTQKGDLPNDDIKHKTITRMGPRCAGQSFSAAPTPTIVVNWDSETNFSESQLRRISLVGSDETLATKKEGAQLADGGGGGSGVFQTLALNEQQCNTLSGSQGSGLSMIAAVNQVRKNSIMLLSSITSRSSQTLRRLSMVPVNPVNSLLSRSKSKQSSSSSSSSSSDDDDGSSSSLSSSEDNSNHDDKEEEDECGGEIEGGAGSTDNNRAAAAQHTKGNDKLCWSPESESRKKDHNNNNNCDNAKTRRTGDPLADKLKSRRLREEKRARRKRKKAKKAKKRRCKAMSEQSGPKKTFDDYLMAVAGVDGGSSDEDAMVSMEDDEDDDDGEDDEEEEEDYEALEQQQQQLDNFKLDLGDGESTKSPYNGVASVRANSSNGGDTYLSKMKHSEVAQQHVAPSSEVKTNYEEKARANESSDKMSPLNQSSSIVRLEADLSTNTVKVDLTDKTSLAKEFLGTKCGRGEEDSPHLLSSVPTSSSPQPRFTHDTVPTMADDGSTCVANGSTVRPASGLHRQGACYERATSRAAATASLDTETLSRNNNFSVVSVLKKTGGKLSAKRPTLELQKVLRASGQSNNNKRMGLLAADKLASKPLVGNVVSGGTGGGPGMRRRTGAKRTSRWHAKRLRAETKAAKTVAIIIGGFIFCWLPFFTAYLSRAIICDRPDCIPQSLLSVFIWLGYLNSAINPVIYGLFSKDFRFAFKNILCRCSFRNNNNDDTVVVSFLVDSIIKSIL